MEEKIKKILLEKVNPILEKHYGGAELAEIRDNTVYIKMLGACGGCPASQMTIEDIIETTIKEELPEIERVALYQGVSDEMLQFAKKLMTRENETLV